jgi:hypothetical protein
MPPISKDRTETMTNSPLLHLRSVPINADTMTRWRDRARRVFGAAPQVHAEVHDLEHDCTCHRLRRVLGAVRYAEQVVDEPLRGEMRALAAEVEALGSPGWRRETAHEQLED